MAAHKTIAQEFAIRSRLPSNLVKRLLAGSQERTSEMTSAIDQMILRSRPTYFNGTNHYPITSKPSNKNILSTFNKYRALHFANLGNFYIPSSLAVVAKNQKKTDSVFCPNEGQRKQLSFRVGAKGMRDGYVRSCIEIRRSTAKVAIFIGAFALWRTLYVH